MDLLTHKKLFFNHIAQTSSNPLAIQPEKADGIYIWDKSGKRYIDLISGFNVMYLGHQNKEIHAAVVEQLKHYSHLMVYGEFVETPQIKYAHLLTQHLPEHLNCVHFTNSGTEATEGAMKLVKRMNHRPHIVAFNNSYHGSTQGALSLMGDEYWRRAFRPLLPGIIHLNYNNLKDLASLNKDVSAVFIEAVQAEAGIVLPDATWLQKLQKTCSKHNILIVVDEIQTGFGRTGCLWAFEKFGIKPDILLLGKALGGGMPLGAFISSKLHLDLLSVNPVLGNISTFGGHPISTAAGLAGFEYLLKHKNVLDTLDLKLKIILKDISKFEIVKEIRQVGLWSAIELVDAETCAKVLKNCLNKGLITDFFIFNNCSLRIAPPLTLSDEEARMINAVLVESFRE
ncbi:MAG: aspartate aminotransferase family protein [Alphaproteobacteria bacterium]|nr:aspartate aminotransferase family protein [Alphaproteobacteria bacterium]